MSRRIARELALQALFQLDFNQTTPAEALESVIEEREALPDAAAREYADLLLTGTLAHKTEIDKLISTISTEWKVDRMAGVDRNIVRLALYEMKFGREKLSVGVVINEAVELAKAFATEESGKFVNGILGSFVKSKAK